MLSTLFSQRNMMRNTVKIIIFFKADASVDADLQRYIDITVNFNCNL